MPTPTLYECHVTCTQADAEIASAVAKALHWKTSEIVRDPVLGDDTFFYLTAHGESMIVLETRMRTCVDVLVTLGVNVRREKIEAIVHDVRYA